MSIQETFINKILPGVLGSFKKYGILPSLSISQACLESAFGRYSIGNNLFGIKADAAWKGKKQLHQTTEYVNGAKVKVQIWFRDYNTIEESITDHSEFLLKPRYQSVRAAKDYLTACAEIQKANYATDPEYSKKLIKIIEKYQLYRFDTAEKPEIKKTVIASALNIRDSASIGSKVVGAYKQGEVVIVTGVSGGWSRTDKGWVSSKYLI